MAAVPLRLTGATRRFRDRGHTFTVFEQLDLVVEDRELFVLLGPSGCGKSTLLRVIAGLERLDDGHVEVAPGDHQRDVGIVFQQPLLLPWLTVADNVALGLGYAANHGARRDGIVQETLEAFGLCDLAGAYPDELSGGQAQRVSLARTVVTQPRVILLDEPFAALDPLTRAAMQQWLLDIQQRLGLTVVLVTHDVDEAVRLGHRVALMSPSPGRICRAWRFSEDERGPSRLSTTRATVLRAYTELASRSSRLPAAAAAAS
jgi:ABC-type nitrate/sulfonate/bicarbonate transport system ATPase subunit